MEVKVLSHLIVLTKRKICIIVFTLVLSLIIPLFTSETVSAQIIIQDLSTSSEYAQPSISKLADRNVISGDENGYFRPNSFVTRAEMVAFVVKAAGYDISNINQVPTFTDVPTDHWAYPYIETAIKRGIIQGTEPGKFSPNSLCTREQASKIIINSVKNNRIALNNSAGEMLNRLKGFNDFNQISSWAVDYVSIAVNLGLIKGTSETTISPSDSIQREQMAVIIDRFINIFTGKYLKPESLYLTGTEQLLDFTFDLGHVNNLKIRKILAADGSEVPFNIEYYYQTGENSYSTENPDQNTKHIKVKILSSELREGETYRVIFSFIYPLYYDPNTLYSEEIIFYELPVKITDALVLKPTYITLGTTLEDVKWITPGNESVYGDVIKTVSFDDGSKITIKLVNGKYVVTGWNNKGLLNIKLGEKVENAPPFMSGSSILDVLNAMGTPDIYIEESNGYTWEYYNSGKIIFDKEGIVTEWTKYTPEENIDSFKVTVGASKSNADKIYMGSPKEDVLSVMGMPDKVTTYIDTSNKKVEGWYYIPGGIINFNIYGNIASISNGGGIKISYNIDPSAPLLRTGLTKEEVIKVCGLPDYDGSNMWKYYSSSWLRFDSNQKVDAIRNDDLLFKVSSAQKQEGSPLITWGSTQDDVVRLMGDPTTIITIKDQYGKNLVEWWYGYGSDVTFDEAGKIIYWRDEFKQARPWEANPNARPITIGSTIYDVADALGYPSNFDSTNNMNSWHYGNSYIMFDNNGKVNRWWNNDGLNISIIAKDPNAEPFTVGSTIYDVAKVMGTPQILELNYINPPKYRVVYGSSTVFLDENYNVISWDNAGNLIVK